MRKCLLAILALLQVVSSAAQQKPHYTQYIQNQFIINPALSGIENYIDVKLSHRREWVGFNTGALTTYFTAQGPLGKKDYRTTPTSSRMTGVNPRGHNYWEQYESAKPHHGIGVQFISDRTGPLSRTEGYLTYAYHLGITPKTSLAAGFGAGIYQINLDLTRLQNVNISDPALLNSSGIFNKFRPDFNAGIYIYSADYFVGISGQQVIPQQVLINKNSLTRSGDNIIPHMFLTAGYRLLMDDNFNLIPSLMVKYASPLQLWQVEVNAKLQYQDLMWAGLSYRHRAGIAAMLGLNISSKVNIGYSYDYMTSNILTFNRNTHELVIGFLVGNTFGDSCPKNVW